MYTQDHDFHVLNHRTQQHSCEDFQRLAEASMASARRRQLLADLLMCQACFVLDCIVSQAVWQTRWLLHQRDLLAEAVARDLPKFPELRQSLQAVYKPADSASSIQLG